MPDSDHLEKIPNRRITYLVVLMCFLALAVVARLVYVQLFRHQSYLEKANAQQSRKFTIEARRGQIFVNDGNGELYPVALNQQLFLLAADPAFIVNPRETLAKLSKYISQPEDGDLLAKISNKDNRYLVLKKSLSLQDAEAIKTLKIPGIILPPQDGRNYPEGELFSHITGYVNNDGVGQYGIEEFFNDSLSGVDGISRAITDSLGVPITSNENTIITPGNGSDLVLTIDRNVQQMAAQAITTAVKNNKAESGSIIVMDPKTGAIRAMANYPSYDPNNYQLVGTGSYQKFINSSITNLFEPGSGFKVITMAAGLDSGKVQSSTKYEDTGEVKIDDRTINNADNKKFGISTMSDVIQKSINTGVVFVLKQLGTDPDKITLKGKEIFYDYIKRFGFGERTGIELSGESKGYIKKPDTYNVDYANMSFGQGLSATSLQLINSVSAIANGGTLYKPYIVEREIKANGEVKQTKPEAIRNNVVSTQSAATLSEMLKQVVAHGSGWPTRTAGYSIGGKTGTAQVPRSDGKGYEEDLNIGSFVGFAPIEDPKFVILVRVDYPKAEGFAEKTAVPAFAEVARQLFIYYQIAPSGN